MGETTLADADRCIVTGTFCGTGAWGSEPACDCLNCTKYRAKPPKLHHPSQIESLQRLLAEKDAQIAELRGAVVVNGWEKLRADLQSANERIEALTAERDADRKNALLHMVNGVASIDRLTCELSALQRAARSFVEHVTEMRPMGCPYDHVCPKAKALIDLLK